MVSNLTLSDLGPPLSKPPPGVTPDFEHPISRAYQYTIAGSICVVLIVYFVAIYTYAQVSGSIRRKTWLANTLFAFGTIMSVVYIGINLYLVIDGVCARHQWEVLLLEETIPLIVLSIVAIVLWALSIMAIKLCLLSLYVEIFGCLRWLKICTYIGGTLLILFNMAFSIAHPIINLPDDPLHATQIEYIMAYISPKFQKGYPISLISHSVINVISDVFLLILPLPAIWSLNLPRRQKLGVLSMFLVGLVALVCSLISLRFRVQLAKFFSDTVWLVVPVQIATTIESTAGIMILCMPSLATLTKKARPLVAHCVTTVKQRHLDTRSSLARHNSHPSKAFSDSCSDFGHGDRRTLTVPVNTSAHRYHEKEVNVQAIALDVIEQEKERSERSSQDMTIRKQTEFTVTYEV